LKRKQTWKKLHPNGSLQTAVIYKPEKQWFFENWIKLNIRITSWNATNPLLVSINISKAEVVLF
jgi:hypothetical protein